MKSTWQTNTSSYIFATFNFRRGYTVRMHGRKESDKKRHKSRRAKTHGMRNEEKLKLHILLTQFPCAFEEKQQIKQQPEEPVEQRNEQKKTALTNL